MIRIAISQAAFDAIAGMLPFPLGSVSYENASKAKGERYVWLDPKVVEHLQALRGPGESYSDVILRLAGKRLQPEFSRTLSPAPWETDAGQARACATIALRHGDASPHKWGGGAGVAHRRLNGKAVPALGPAA
jgi:hypothetical protein